MRSDAILAAREPEDDLISEPAKPKGPTVRSIVQRVDTSSDSAAEERHQPAAVR